MLLLGLAAAADCEIARVGKKTAELEVRSLKIPCHGEAYAAKIVLSFLGHVPRLLFVCFCSNIISHFGSHITFHGRDALYNITSSTITSHLSIPAAISPQFLRSCAPRNIRCHDLSICHRASLRPTTAVLTRHPYWKDSYFGRIIEPRSIFYYTKAELQLLCG